MRSGRRGDEEFAEFARASSARLQRAAYLLTGDRHQAEEAAQAALVRVYASWGRVRRVENLEAYARRVLLNALFDQRGRRSSGEIVLAEMPEQPGPDGSPELHVTLVRALAGLPVRDRAIVVLRHWEDLSVETVAEILGVSVSVVKMQNARSLTRLRALLGEDFVMS